jgi:hypothetical protein
VTFLSPVECGNLVKQMVKHRLVTKQTPPEGVEVQKVRFDINSYKYQLNFFN